MATEYVCWNADFRVKWLCTPWTQNSAASVAELSLAIMIDWPDYTSDIRVSRVRQGKLRISFAVIWSFVNLLMVTAFCFGAENNTAATRISLRQSSSHSVGAQCKTATAVPTNSWVFTDARSRFKILIKEDVNHVLLCTRHCCCCYIQLSQSINQWFADSKANNQRRINCRIACADFPNVVAQCHIFGVRTQGGYDPHIRTRPRFLNNAPALKFHHPMFTRSEVIVLINKQTHTQTQTDAAENIQRSSLRYDVS